MAVEWTAGEVDPSSQGQPEPDEWSEVTVPGRPAEFADAAAVAYRTTFADPRSTPDQRTILELYGAYAHATIWLNGDRLGTHDAYFVPARFEFDPEPENDLHVVCRAPTDRFGGVHATDRVPAEKRVPGIWWTAAVRVRPPTYVADLTLTPRQTADGGEIGASVTIDSSDGVDDRVTLSLRPEGFRGGGAMERLPIEAAPGSRTTASRTLEVRNPGFWWPNGLGEQYRYTVRAKFGDHETTATTGFCDVRRDGDQLLINEEPVTLRGFDVLPSDDPIADVERAIDANANVLRAYGHVPPRTFHEACTEAGVLVWQDLPLVGPGPFDVERGRALASGLASEYGQHPSVGLFGVHAEPIEPFEAPIGSGRLGRLRVRWRAWRAGYDRDPADRVAEAFPDDVLALPVAGTIGSDPDAATVYPGWDFGSPEDVEWVLDRYPSLGRFVGGFGAAALAGSVENRPDHFEWAVHDARVGSDDPAESQAYQANLLETIAEALRRRGCSLQTVDCLRDSFRTGGRGVLAADGDAKSGFDAVADSFEPVQAILDGPPATADGIVVCNDTRERIEGTLSWSTPTADESVPVEVTAMGRTTVEAVELPADGRIRLELSVGDRSVVNEYRF